jgi:hypothetical protein
MKKVSLPSDRHELFAKVVTHLLTQKERSCKSDGTCMYRHESLKCAAGCLLPDDFDFDACNDWDWETLIGANLVEEKHKSLINALQKIHDTVVVNMWPVALYNLARKRWLKIPAVLNKALTDSGEVENE